MLHATGTSSGPAARRARRLLWLGALTIAAVTALILVPRLAASDTRERSLRQALEDVRTAIRVFQEARAKDGWGADRPPTLTELQTPGVVLAGDLPTNPFAGSSQVQPMDASQRATPNAPTTGWCYDERSGTFWSASTNENSNLW